jgi:hypothetical protein
MDGARRIGHHALGNDPTTWWTFNRACVEAVRRDLGVQQIRFTQPDWWWRRGMSHAGARC